MVTEQRRQNGSLSCASTLRVIEQLCMSMLSSQIVRLHVLICFWVHAGHPSPCMYCMYVYLHTCIHTPGTCSCVHRCLFHDVLPVHWSQ